MMSGPKVKPTGRRRKGRIVSQGPETPQRAGVAPCRDGRTDLGRPHAGAPEATLEHYRPPPGRSPSVPQAPLLSWHRFWQGNRFPGPPWLEGEGPRFWSDWSPDRWLEAFQALSREPQRRQPGEVRPSHKRRRRKLASPPGGGGPQGRAGGGGQLALPFGTSNPGLRAAKPRPAACDRCGSYAPDTLAIADAWLCFRCKFGRLPDRFRWAVRARIGRRDG